MVLFGVPMGDGLLVVVGMGLLRFSRGVEFEVGCEMELDTYLGT